MKPTYYWLTREDRESGGGYWLFYTNGQHIRWFCSRPWHGFTGVRLKEGTKAKVKVTKLKNGFKMEVVK